MFAAAVAAQHDALAPAIGAAVAGELLAAVVGDAERGADERIEPGGFLGDGVVVGHEDLGVGFQIEAGDVAAVEALRTEGRLDPVGALQLGRQGGDPDRLFAVHGYARAQAALFEPVRDVVVELPDVEHVEARDQSGVGVRGRGGCEQTAG